MGSDIQFGNRRSNNGTPCGQKRTEAIENKTLIKAVPGKSIIEVAREDYLAKKKSETVSVQLPKPLIAIIKRQAKRFSIPWTSYIKEALEADVNRTAKLNAVAK